MKIVVLVKQVPDTWSDRKISLETGMLERDRSDPVADEINERALEVALRVKDTAPDTEIIALSMGDEGASKALRKLLSMGADSAALVSDGALAGADMLQTARVLAAAVQRLAPEVVVAGNEATDGRGGMVPAMLAELLGWPVLPGLDDVELTAERVSGTAQVDGGSLHLSAAYPAVVSVSEKAAEARFPNFKGIMAAKKKPLLGWDLAALGLAAGPDAASVRSIMVSAAARPAKTAGPKVVDDGTAASRLAEFLADRRLL